MEARSRGWCETAQYTFVRRFIFFIEERDSGSAYKVQYQSERKKGAIRLSLWDQRNESWDAVITWELCAAGKHQYHGMVWQLYQTFCSL